MKKLTVLVTFVLEEIKRAIGCMGFVKGEAPTGEPASTKASAIASNGTNRPAPTSLPLLDHGMTLLKDKAQKILAGQVGYWAPKERAFLRSQLRDQWKNFSDEKLARALLELD